MFFPLAAGLFPTGFDTKYLHVVVSRTYNIWWWVLEVVEVVEVESDQTRDNILTKTIGPTITFIA